MGTEKEEIPKKAQKAILPGASDKLQAVGASCGNRQAGARTYGQDSERHKGNQRNNRGTESRGSYEMGRGDE